MLGRTGDICAPMTDRPGTGEAATMKNRLRPDPVAAKRFLSPGL